VDNQHGFEVKLLGIKTPYKLLYIIYMNDLIKDTSHWQNLKPPLSPNEYEVELYRHHIKGHGPICLLGMTKELIKLCDFMVDLNPIQQEKPVLRSDWSQINRHVDVIIGDGVLNLCGLDLLNNLLKITNKLICRVFMNKLEGMKYATYFPNEFPGSSLVIPTQENVVMVIWEK
jgi:hypothetical protein